MIPLCGEMGCFLKKRQAFQKKKKKKKIKKKIFCKQCAGQG